ncbi:hypothetical protein SAMN05216474_1990 [Lishizhenia tianjinensis]|uniref:Lipoprotein n=1 Tax=Lishizhenia tianjinensis TaxID=477690 RepID=A0A1I7ADW6_9FLAO|nr:hypothetical protein [Lishizhenia tianjinensis]SFT73142.1 hypothetical protein SAMN05216474_1990 [Lishizhenia tianjinensis]
MKKNTILGLIFSAILMGCTTESTTDTPSITPETPVFELSIEERAQRFMENQLGINAAEEYKFFSYDAHVNTDTLMDKVFVLQREKYAFEKVEKVGSMKNFQDMEYNSPENYLFLYDAARDEFVATPGIGANITQPLEVSFHKILSPAKQDIIVDYRVVNGLYRSIYAYADQQLLKVLSFPLIADLGDENEAAYVPVYQKGSASIAQDIWLYKAEMNYDIDSLKANPNFLPERKQSEKLYLRFIFDPKRFKYVTPGYEQEEDRK